MIDGKEKIREVIRGINQEGAKQQRPRMRQIIIETDGNHINLLKDESAGIIELKAICASLINFLNTRGK